MTEEKRRILDLGIELPKVKSVKVEGDTAIVTLIADSAYTLKSLDAQNVAVEAAAKKGIERPILLSITPNITSEKVKGKTVWVRIMKVQMG